MNRTHLFAAAVFPALFALALFADDEEMAEEMDGGMMSGETMSGKTKSGKTKTVGAFERNVLPLLRENCFECHSAEKRKPKGKLRLDSPEWISRGGKNGPVLVAGKPQQSAMFTRCSLPDDHDDVMPPNGEVLAKKDLELVRQWIANGADFGGWTGAVAAKAGGSVAVDPGVKRTTVNPNKQRERLRVFRELDERVSAPSSSGMKAAKEAGARAVPVLPEGNLLRVEFVRDVGSIDDKAFSKITPLVRNIAILSLRGTAITDRSMALVAKMPNLVRLDLPRTAITDAGLKTLGKAKPAMLRTINLYGTKITDAGLDRLVTLPGLRDLYVWDTKVSAAGANSFSRMIRGCKVHFQRKLPKPEAPSQNNGNGRRRKKKKKKK